MAGMKLRQTTALALVVWYLMVPPHRICVTCRDYFQPEREDLPVHKWQQAKHFDTLPKCEASLRWFQKNNRRRFLKRARVSYIARYGQCVASDDPRLKEK
jgi:hypothetical protein